MKKIINKIEDILKEMLIGAKYLDSNIEVDLESQVIYKKKIDKSKVSLISGGGSGHEPAHGGYVKADYLDAAVAGNIFTSPTPDMILKAMQYTKSDKGALLIVKNYSGDLMNF